MNQYEQDYFFIRNLCRTVVIICSKLSVDVLKSNNIQRVATMRLTAYGFQERNVNTVNSTLVYDFSTIMRGVNTDSVHVD
jgi:hypothetical protein